MRMRSKAIKDEIPALNVKLSDLTVITTVLLVVELLVVELVFEVPFEVLFVLPFGVGTTFDVPLLLLFALLLVVPLFAVTVTVAVIPASYYCETHNLTTAVSNTFP